MLTSATAQCCVLVFGPCGAENKSLYKKKKIAFFPDEKRFVSSADIRMCRILETWVKLFNDID